MRFYHGVLGFDDMGVARAFRMGMVSAGRYHHHIGLNTWYSKNAPHAPAHSVGLFHTAILYPERRDLAVIFDRIHQAKYHLSGVSDHGVSEALYLDDPDGNGVELYWDRPKDQWPLKPDGSLEMFTKPLDFQGLLKELDK